jgi:hypothetical protein
MYKSEVIDKDTVEKRIVTRLIVLWKKKRKKLFHDRIIIEDGGIEEYSIPFKDSHRNFRALTS